MDPMQVAVEAVFGAEQLESGGNILDLDTLFGADVTELCSVQAVCTKLGLSEAARATFIGE